jgi:DNA-nicking Smr family endonuclease
MESSMSFDEKYIADDFLSAMSDVTPLGPDDKVITSQAEKTLAQQLRRKALEQQLNQANNFLSSEISQLVAPNDILGFKQDGVQEGVYKNLRLGKYLIEDVLNLQQTNVETSRQLLFDTIRLNQEKGIRCMLIKHGRGEKSKPKPGYLKSAINQWLIELPQIIAFHSAQLHHGGSASVYALLKKSEQQKSHNRELHRKK